MSPFGWAYARVCVRVCTAPQQVLDLKMNASACPHRPLCEHVGACAYALHGPEVTGAYPPSHSHPRGGRRRCPSGLEYMRQLQWNGSCQGGSWQHKDAHSTAEKCDVKKEHEVTLLERDVYVYIHACTRMNRQTNIQTYLDICVLLPPPPPPPPSVTIIV